MIKLLLYTSYSSNKFRPIVSNYDELLNLQTLIKLKYKYLCQITKTPYYVSNKTLHDSYQRHHKNHSHIYFKRLKTSKTNVVSWSFQTNKLLLKIVLSVINVRLPQSSPMHVTHCLLNVKKMLQIEKKIDF
jgi:hypothetical protein